MASVHRNKHSPYWYAAYYGPDGERCFKSTKAKKKRDAFIIALEWESAARLGRAKRLTESKVRSVLADIFTKVNADELPTATVGEFLTKWAKRKALEVADTSAAAYARTCELLRRILKHKVNRPVDSLTLADAIAFRDTVAEAVSPVTTNKQLKIARVIWNDAIRDGLTQDNVFAKVKRLKAVGARRRAFTLPELRRVLAACNTEWRGMVLAGLYLGQRLSDLASLTWQNVDLAEQEICLTTGKTGRAMHIPLAAPLEAYLVTLPAADNPEAPIFPTLRGLQSNTLSAQFASILASVGLGQPVSHRATKRGREVRRDLSNLSFHCLRHTATSLLKNAGVSDVVARELIGHDSIAVSRVYTHIETKTLRKAVAQMPDITKEQAE